MDSRMLTVGDVHQLTGLSRNTILSYIRGSGVIGEDALGRLDLKTVAVLMVKLGVSFGELFDITQKPSFGCDQNHKSDSWHSGKEWVLYSKGEQSKVFPSKP